MRAIASRRMMGVLLNCWAGWWNIRLPSIIAISLREPAPGMNLAAPPIQVCRVLEISPLRASRPVE
jgi:hypothetical protein